MNDKNKHGYALAARVLQSDLYHQLDDLERAECDSFLPSRSPQPVAVQEALRAFARAAVSICDSAAQGYKADSHPFNDKFGDAPEKLIAAETKATTCRELSWKIRQEAEKHLRAALAATQQGVNHE